MSYTVSQSILVTAQPPSGADFPDASMQMAMPVRTRTYQHVVLAPSQEYVGATAEAISIPSSGVNYLYARVTGGMLYLHMTTLGNTLQVVPVDDVLLFSNNTTPITALVISGTGVLELFLAGN